MAERVSAMDVRQRLGDLLNRVSLRQDEFVIERNGKALAAIVPVARLVQMQDAARSFLLNILKTRSDIMTQDQADQLAAEARNSARKKKK